MQRSSKRYRELSKPVEKIHNLAWGNLEHMDGEYQFKYNASKDVVQWSLGDRAIRMPASDFIDLAGAFYTSSRWIINHKTQIAVDAELELLKLKKGPAHVSRKKL